MFGKLLKMKYNLNPILHNRVILYALTAIALFDLIFFLNTKDMFSFLILILIGFLTSFFSKNMTVILFITIVITHILKYGKSSFSEGLDNMDNNKESEHDETNNKNLNVVETTKKLDNYTKQMDDIIKSKEDDKSDELMDNLKDMQNTRNAIVEKVQNMKPLIEKFQGHLEKFQTIKDKSEKNSP